MFVKCTFPSVTRAGFCFNEATDRFFIFHMKNKIKNIRKTIKIQRERQINKCIQGKSRWNSNVYLFTPLGLLETMV